jgi:hypothetical protein
MANLLGGDDPVVPQLGFHPPPSALSNTWFGARKASDYTLFHTPAINEAFTVWSITLRLCCYLSRF